MSRLVADPITFRLPNGMTAFGLNENDTMSVYRDIFDDDCYRRHGITIEDGDVILDVGANTGLFVLFLNQIRAKVHVFSFEPAPPTFEVLRRNAASCTNLQAEVFNVGFARQSGHGQFTYYPRFSNASTLYPDESAEGAARGRQYVIDMIRTLRPPLRTICEWLPTFVKIPVAEMVRRFHLKKETVRCELWNLSDFLRDHSISHVDLLKMDAEQSEEEIFAGIRDDDWPKIRQIVVEVHGGDPATREMCAMLESKGFHTVIDDNPAIPTLKLVYARRPR